MRRTRRTFLKRSGLGMAGATLWGWNTTFGGGGANERVVLGVIGCGGRGTSLAEMYAAFDDARVKVVCDPDDAHAGETAREVEKKNNNKRPATIRDLRKVLDDPEIDAVVVATPDHWHAPAAILACEAGKHVYVEKPCSHTLREGRALVDAARRHKRVVQIGTQGRSTSHIQRAIERLHDGAIGDVLVAKAWNSQKRKNIGREKPSTPPAGIDYDLWLGPAPHVPYQSNRLHSDWHWWYAFGTGGMGNDGIHEVDIARWGLGVEEHPAAVSAQGSQLFFDDDQEFADTQYVVFQYGDRTQGASGKQLVYEQRLWSPYVQETHENGNAFYGTRGMLVLGRKEGWKLYGPRNQLVESSSSVRWRGEGHCRNFLDAVKGREASRAEIETGHLTTALVHLGNASARLGASFRFDPKSEQVLNCHEAQKLLSRDYRSGHWAVPSSV